MNISVEVTGNLLKYLDAKVKSGLFKSRSEVVRQAIREMIQIDLAAQLETKGITVEDIERMREDMAEELQGKKYGKKRKRDN